MRYSLATLVILTVLAPPLMALAWFLAPTDFMLRARDASLYPGILTALVLIGFSLAYRPGAEVTPTRISLPAAFILWCFESMALWTWVSMLIALFGWVFVWGDNGPPVPTPFLYGLAALIAAGVASITSLRMKYGVATFTYLATVVCLTTALLILFAPALLWSVAVHGRLPIIFG